MEIKDLIKTLKINHYIKNIVVFLPLIFSMNFSNTNLLKLETLMFISFCLISSCIYIFNDLIDINSDKEHPQKSKRPIASGKITKLEAICLSIFLLILSSYISLSINELCFYSILSYTVLNIFYSIYLKKIELIDVICIAIGFIIRILSGCAAIMVVPSALVILLTFFMSMFFTFSKRFLELKLLKDKNIRRTSITNYSPELLRQYIIMNAVLSIAFYFTYVLDEKTILKAGTEFLYITVIPFSLIFFRIIYLLNKEESSFDPIKFIEKDTQTKILILIFVVTFAIILTIK